jgi:lysophospholipase L1-like esterase
MHESMNIHVFGDSILRGVLLDPVNKRYYPLPDDRFRRFEEQFGLKLHNKSSFGCIIGKGYRKVRAMLSGDDQPCDIAVLEYGGNDCDFNWAEVAEKPDSPHEPNTPLAVFKNTYLQIINDLKSRSIVPVIMSLPPICAEKYFNWITRNGLSKEKILSWLGDVQTIARYQELYSLAVTEIALSTSSQLIDIRSAFLERRDYARLICDDGIHPNLDGHELITKVCTDFAASHQSLLSAV